MTRRKFPRPYSCHRLECVFMTGPHYQISSEAASWHVGPLLLTPDMIWVPSTIYIVADRSCQCCIVWTRRWLRNPGLAGAGESGHGRLACQEWGALHQVLRLSSRAPGAEGTHVSVSPACQHGPCDLTKCKYYHGSTDQMNINTYTYLYKRLSKSGHISCLIFSVDDNNPHNHISESLPILWTTHNAVKVRTHIRGRVKISTHDTPRHLRRSKPCLW